MTDSPIQRFQPNCLTSKVLTATHTYEEVIKKSLFIGVCTQVNSPEDFFQFLAQYQDVNATHNCWAYRIENIYRFNDDGEPSGTAGKPILAAIDGAGFDYVGALVIRHYGGIKLGTGGLARAYGGTISKNLKSAPHKIHVPLIEASILVSFQHDQCVYQLLQQHQGQSIKQQFTTHGTEHHVVLPEELLKSFVKDLKNKTKGTAKVTVSSI